MTTISVRWVRGTSSSVGVKPSKIKGNKERTFKRAENNGRVCGGPFRGEKRRLVEG